MVRIYQYTQNIEMQTHEEHWIDAQKALEHGNVCTYSCYMFMREHLTYTCLGCTRC